MRRFRFICPDDEIESYVGKMKILKKFQVYTEEEISNLHDSWKSPENSLVWQDWQEVFDEPKPLYKDTDLGWAVSVLLRSGWNIHEVVKDAKELIKQLDKESPHNLPPNHNE